MSLMCFSSQNRINRPENTDVAPSAPDTKLQTAAERLRVHDARHPTGETTEAHSAANRLSYPSRPCAACPWAPRYDPQAERRSNPPDSGVAGDPVDPRDRRVTEAASHLTVKPPASHLCGTGWLLALLTRLDQRVSRKIPEEMREKPAGLYSIRSLAMPPVERGVSGHSIAQCWPGLPADAASPLNRQNVKPGTMTRIPLLLLVVQGIVVMQRGDEARGVPVLRDICGSPLQGRATRITIMPTPSGGVVAWPGVAPVGPPTTEVIGRPRRRRFIYSSSLPRQAEGQ